MSPAALCADCGAPLYPDTATPTDRGWTHTDRPLCDGLAQLNDPTGDPMQVRVAALYASGRSFREINELHGWGKHRIRKALDAQGVPVRASGKQLHDQEHAFTGRWVRVGLIWKPVAA